MWIEWILIIDEQKLRSHPSLSYASRVLRIPIPLIIISILLVVGVVLLPPTHITVITANALVLVPAYRDFRMVGSQARLAIHQTQQIVDYWSVIGTTIMLENLLGIRFISWIVPLWWTAKGWYALHYLLNESFAEINESFAEGKQAPSPVVVRPPDKAHVG